MSNNLDRRIKALETQLVTEPIVLHFADGSSTKIPSKVRRRDHVAELLGCAVRGERSREMDLIANAASFSEPGGGHLCELAKAIWLSPTEEGQ